MIDFPASPTIGQQFTAAGVVWTWDGTKWLPAGLSPTVVPGINDNRLINGDMRIDQRNAGASGTAAGYTVDRWAYGASQVSKFSWQRNSNSPAAPGGFPYGLLLTSASAFTPAASDYFQVFQAIEADAISDFQFGSASAQPVTLSFWVYSSLTGTHSGYFGNNAGTRTYPFTYSIPTANTWTRIVITIPGDTAGTWVLSGNGGSATLGFDLGSGSTYRGTANVWTSTGLVGVTGAVRVVSTNGAIWLITGVKLEVGSVATPYNRQSLAKSLADCQRYYQAGQIYMTNSASSPAGFTVACSSLHTPMRATATMVVTANNNANISSLAVVDGGTIFYASGTATATGNATLNINFTASAEL
jgi:hypothetical protein